MSERVQNRWRGGTLAGLVGALLLTAVPSQTAQAAIIPIDDFTTAFTGGSANSGSALRANAGLPTDTSDTQSITGFQRTGEVRYNNNDASVEMSINTGNQSLIFATGPNTFGEGELTYTLDGADLSEALTIEIGYEFADLGGGQDPVIDVQLLLDGTDAGTETISENGDGTLVFDLSGIDSNTLANLTELSFLITHTGGGADVIFTGITYTTPNGNGEVPIPEPASLVIWGLLGTGLTAGRKFRSKRA